MFRTVALLALYVITASQLCRGCECIASLRSCENMRSAVIFVGRVLETKPVRHPMGKDSYSPGYSMRFSVEETIKGTPSREITIETGNGGGDCGTPLRPGDKFLIFAYRNTDGVLWTGMCSGNRLLSGEVGEENYLNEFRTLAKLNTVTIFGRVWSTRPIWRDDEVFESGDLPKPGVVIRAKGTDIERTTRTDQFGSFEFQGLPNEKYAVSPERLDGLDYSHEFEENYEATLSNGECKDISFKLEPSTRIRGRILLPKEISKNAIQVEAIPTTLKKMNQFSGQSDFVGEHGEFDLWPLPPGDYYVGVNINSSPKADSPIPPTYFPGVTNRASARVIHVGLGEVKEIELPISQLAVERVVHFVATGLDGKPLKTIYIQLEDLRHPGDASSYVNVDLDQGGRGTMSVFAGYAYHLHGSHWISYLNDWCAKPVEIPAGTGPIDVRFEMDTKSDNCDIYEIDHLKR